MSSAGGSRFTHRMLRRLAWLSAAAAVAGAVALAIVLLPHADERPPLDPAELALADDAQLPAPAAARLELTPALRAELLSTARRFIKSSVRRDHPERSWEIIHPTLRQGLTRAEWSTGNIPVVPFPAIGEVGWRIDEASVDDVLLEVVLVPEPKSGLLGKTFQIELRPSRNRTGHWLVASWVPHGVSSAQMAIDAEARDAGTVPPHRRGLSSAWLALPLALLALTIVAPIAVFAVGAWRNRQAERAYRDSLRMRP